MGEEFAFGRICPPHLLQQLHDGLVLLLLGHHDLRDVLVVSVQAGPRLLERLVRHAAAADVYLPQLGVVPGVDHLGTAGLQHFPHRVLDHLHIVRLNVLKPAPVALLRPDVVRHAQEDAHSSVSVHPGLAALLQLNGPDAGSRSLQNVLQALPGFQLIFLLLLHHGVDIPQGKNRTVLLLRLSGGGKMNLHVLQPIGTVLHLIADIEFFIGLKLGQHIVPFRHGAQPVLVPGNHVPGDVPLHGRLITVLEIGGPVHAHLLAVPIDLVLACAEVHQIDAQVVHAEGVEDVIAPLLELPDQIPALQGGHDKIRRGLEHIGRVFHGLHGGIVHTVKTNHLLAVVEGDHHQGMDALPL